jgi:hypothetical protein
MSAFSAALQRYLTHYQALQARKASEASLRDAFLTFLREAFPHLKEPERLELEKYIPALRVRGGFADVLYEDLIFEFKRQLTPAVIEEAKPQLQRYLLNLPQPEKYFGILTDGLQLEVYALRDGELTRIDSLSLEANSPEEIATCKGWLDAYLFHEQRLSPTTADIVRRFGEHSPTFHQGLRILRALWQEAQSDLTAQTKMAEWQNLLSLVYGSPVGDEALFLRHTYLALFARVLAFIVLTQNAPAATDLPALLSGEAFQQIGGLDNFGQTDFFVWMPAEHPDIRAFLQALALRLVTTYDLSTISEDLLKGLYQELVDTQTRHDLGEFYTPDWLAEKTLREAGFLEAESPSLLDPACGSGTFLFTAIRLQKEKLEGPDLVKWATTHLAGLEVHPLAVFIAQTNFLLALRPHHKAYGERLHIPIYMADALSLPEKYTPQACLQVSVPVDEIVQKSQKDPRGLPSKFFEIPLTLAQRPDLFHEALSALMELAQPNRKLENAREGLEKRLREPEMDGFPSEHIPTWQRNLHLMYWLLKKPPTDSVWGFILRNAYQPALLAYRKFDFVAGNPPWIAYRFIQRPDYQERLRTLATQTYKLLQTQDTHLFTQMEVATLFFAVCERHYLREGGTLAFVMPRSILTGAKQHAAFQKQYLSAAYRLLDCEKVRDLFRVPTCVVLYKKGSAPSASPIPMKVFAGKLPVHNAKWEQAKQHLTITETFFTVPTPLGQSPYLSRLTQGATIVPRTFWFIRPHEKAQNLVKRRPQVQTDPRIQPQAKAPWKDISLQGAVEAKYLYATLLSDDMLPFGWRRLSLIVLPLNKEERRPVSYDEADRNGHTGLAKWLSKADAHWQEHRKSQEDLLSYLNWQNKITAQTPLGPYKLLYNTSGTHLCACVVDTKEIVKVPIYDLHVQGFVADTKTYWLETEAGDEAYYLAAVLNAPSVDEFIKPFQTKGAFGAQSGKGERDIHRRPFEVLPIPKYDPSDERHRALAALSRDCHEKVAAFVRALDEKTLSQRVGALRKQVRKYLNEELKAIEALVGKILPLCPAPSPEGKED